MNNGLNEKRFGRSRRRVYNYSLPKKKKFSFKLPNLGIIEWFKSWNYFAPFIWLGEWLKKHERIICKRLFTLSAIIIGFNLAPLVQEAVPIVIASYTDAQSIKRLERERIEKEAREKEEAIKQKIIDERNKLLYDEKAKEEAEKRRIIEVEEEIKQSFGIGDWILITWWGSYGTGPDAPLEASCTGQIQGIHGEYVYGSWGDTRLKWGTDHFHTCSKKDYLNARDKEMKRKNKLQNKKKFKSWGLYPGTVKSSSIKK